MHMLVDCTRQARTFIICYNRVTHDKSVIVFLLLTTKVHVYMLHNYNRLGLGAGLGLVLVAGLGLGLGQGQMHVLHSLLRFPVH